MSARPLTLQGVMLAALSATLLAPAAPASAAPIPAWDLTLSSTPTNFSPGATPEGFEAFDLRPQYTLMATNVGPVPSSGVVTIEDTIPAGLTPVSPVIRLELGETPCEVTAQTVACALAEQVMPGRTLQVAIPVEVSGGASSPLFDEAMVSGGGGGEAIATTSTDVEATPASFGFISGVAGFSAGLSDPEGGPESKAGSHPYQFTINVGFPSQQTAGGGLISAGHVRDTSVTLPSGLIVNPRAAPVRCTESQLESGEGGSCPDASQVGLIGVRTRLGSVTDIPSRLYNMDPPRGLAAEFGSEIGGIGIFIHIAGRVDADGNYTLAADTNEILARENNPILGAQVQLWGDPSSSSHDTVRGKCLVFGGSCPVAPTTTPLLSAPTACRATHALSASADTWERPAGWKPAPLVTLEDFRGNSVDTEGCGAVPFGPSFESRPTTNAADSPTGLRFHLSFPQQESLSGRAEAHLKEARVTLPPGMAVNPSGANGLGACSSQQIGLVTPVGQSDRIRFDEEAAHCPDDAKIGTLTVETQLLDHSLPGAIFVAQPFENPFGSLLAIYLVVDDPASGVLVKLPGEVHADPVTGQLTATFRENPELPFKAFDLEFFAGARAALKTPLECGLHTTSATFTPWSAPEGAALTASDSFQTAAPPSGSSGCPVSEAASPNAPAFIAGTLDPVAGAYSPVVLKLDRSDGTQRIGAINALLPTGLTGRLAGIPYCSESQIAAATAREAPDQGRAEISSPSCPRASEVGTVVVGAGAGPMPYHVSGHAYLAGPYRHAPLSLVIITPAVAGPYDLGTVVVRTALFVDPETAQIHAVSDPLPTILDGIPLDVRSIALEMDRPEFTLNPTSCDPMSFEGEAISTLGQVAPLANRFQVGGCRRLAFKPRLALRVSGPTGRTGKPGLRAVLRAKPGEAGIARAQVNLPHSEFIEQAHIKTVCTRVQFAAGSGDGTACPRSSVYGKAKAWTPLLDEPLEGPVYLRSSSHELPDLVAALHGQVDITLVGKVDSGPNKGIRNTFELVPDAPVSRFVLEMRGGRKGLLVNSEDLCFKKAKRRAIVRFTGHNGKVEHFKPRVRNDCRKHKASHRGRGNR
jgi:hypothetical protein